MSIGGHARQTPDKGIHVSISWTFADAAARAAFTPTSGIPTSAGALTSDDLGKFAWDLDSDQIYMLNGIGPPTWVPIGGTPTDEFVKVSGNDTTTGYLSDKIVAGTGITLTELNDGADEDLEVALDAHAPSHEAGGSDEIDLANLGTGETDTTYRLRPDGSEGVEWVPAGDLTDFSSGSDTTSGGTFLTKASITIPAEDATFIIRAKALVSFSNATGNPEIRIHNVTDAATLGRVWNSEMADSENILSAVLDREFVQTSGAGAKVLALQYAVGSGAGTLTISDAYLTARREIS